MRPRRSVPYFFAIILATSASAAGGCHGFARPVSVQVFDAETRAPVPGASILVTDPSKPQAKIATAETGADGVAHLKLHPTAEFGFDFLVTAPNYLPNQKDLGIEVIRAIPSGTFAHAAPDSPTLTLAVYSCPRATVDLTLPAGYRGVLRAQMQTRTDVVYPPGQRSFQFDVPANGVVQVVGPPVLIHAVTPDVRAKYADGTVLKRDAKDHEVGLRFVLAAEREQIFVIGTKSDCEYLSKSIIKEEPHAHHGGGSGGHQGGGGGMGGMGGGRGMGGGGMGMGGMGGGGMGGGRGMGGGGMGGGGMSSIGGSNSYAR